jgi:hypothetical protein
VQGPRQIDTVGAVDIDCRVVSVHPSGRFDLGRRDIASSLRALHNIG